MAEPSPAGHPVSSISNPQNPAQALTDGVDQLNINKEQKGQQQQNKKEKKDKKKDGKPTNGDSDVPLEVSRIVMIHSISFT